MANELAIDASEVEDPVRLSHQRSRPSWRVLRLRVARCLLDWSALSLALWLAFLARFGWPLVPREAERMLSVMPILIGVQYLVLISLRVPRSSWKLTSLREASRIAAALVLSTVILLALRYGGGALPLEFGFPRALLVPSSIVLIDAALALLALTGIRAMRRWQGEYVDLLDKRGGPVVQRRAIIIGAGSSGQRLVKELRARPDLGIQPVAFLDDKLDEYLHGRNIHGIPVLGTTGQLSSVARKQGASLALIAITCAQRSAMQRIVKACEVANLETKIVPPLHDVISGRVGISQVRDVAIEDLLGREPVDFSKSSALADLAGRVVVVTGAGGSIGSELCRQILSAGPKQLLLVERAEGSLFDIHRELIADTSHPDVVVPAIADVTDARRMRALFRDFRPDVVFHAAAHKHVPMMERNPAEAIKNNFLGTKQVVDLSCEFGVRDFVLISTDKAVNPTSVMGASKRLAELYMQARQKTCPTRLVAVRFGNVLGSSGSVIPLFREQIAKGGPVTVTHPGMTRYFMTIPEACRLVLEAGSLGTSGAIMVLDMGEPIGILDLAEQMIRLSGFEPGEDIEIQFVGLRPGEKLTEELCLDQERTSPTPSEKIFVWRSDVAAVEPMEVTVRRFRGVEDQAPDEVMAHLMGVIPEFRPLDPLRARETAGASPRPRSVAARPSRPTFEDLP